MEASPETPQSLVSPASSMYSPKKTHARGTHRAGGSGDRGTGTGVRDTRAGSSGGAAGVAEGVDAQETDYDELEPEPEPVCN